MKILFLLHSSKMNEGSNVAALSIIKTLLKNDIQVHVVCPTKGDVLSRLYELGVDATIISYAMAIYPPAFNFRNYLTLPKRLAQLLWLNHTAEKQLAKLVKQYQPDIIHTNVGVLRVGYYVATKFHIPHVWHVRETENGLFFHHYPFCRWQRKLLKKNVFDIAITKNVKEFYKLDENNTRVVYDGVFSENLAFTTLCKKENYILFVGRITKEKGADWAIESFIQIADEYPNMRLLLAGADNGVFADSLKNRVNKTSYSSRIKFMGLRNDIYYLMSKAQAILVPSPNEGFGFITAEAMVNRTIVIGRNTGGTKEQFDNGLKLTGHEIALRCESVDDMAHHLANVCTNGQEYYKDMIDFAEQVVRQLYTIEKNAEQIINIYKSLKQS